LIRNVGYVALNVFEALLNLLQMVKQPFLKLLALHGGDAATRL
jgi:hypothetical protein